MIFAVLKETLCQRPLSMIFDIDGTLSPIGTSPGSVGLYPGVKALLEKMRRKAYIAILTGRTVESGAMIVNVENIIYMVVLQKWWRCGQIDVIPLEQASVA